MPRIYKKKDSDNYNFNHKIAKCKSLNRPIDDITRFWSYVDIRGLFDCWEWKGFLNKDGYGHFRFNKHHIKANRFSYQLYHGEIPEGKLVCHKCNNPKCVNPFHLYAGTPQDNMADKVRTNRQARLRGESNGHSELTEKQVLEIRKNKDNLSQRELGELYNIGISAIGHIIRKETWKYLEVK